MFRHLGTLGLVAGLAASAHAQTPPAPEALDWMRVRTGERILQQPYLWSTEQVDAMLRPLFLAISRDGARITREDRAAAERAALAQARPTAMSQFLRADVGGTGRVDRETMSAAVALATRPPRSKDDPGVRTIVDGYFRQADADRDGVVTYEEAVNAADAATARSTRAGATAVPMELDLDGDGTIGLDEFGAVLRVVFEEIDSDRDGRISQAEAERFRSDGFRSAQRAEGERASRRTALEAARRNAVGCAIPAWPVGTGLAVVVASRGGRALANVTIGSGEVKTGAVNVHVEPGSQPLSVVLTAPEPTIWQFSGETARIASVFVAQDDERLLLPRGPQSRATKWESRSGVVGIEQARVTFAPEPACLPSVERATPEALEAALSRRPDVVVTRSGMTTARLPSGTPITDGVFPNSIELPKGGPGGPLWEMLADRRETVVHVDPASVVAVAPAARGSLPGLAGLATLVDEGRARIATWQTVTRFLDASGRQVGPTIIGPVGATRSGAIPGVPTVGRVPSEVMILAPVTIPAGLYGSGIRRLILARGVPAPAGDRAICIIREEDGQPLPGWRCF